jgi:hypothetical protein
MAKKQSLNAAAGEPQGYEYPGTIAGRKFVFEELTIKAIRQFQDIREHREDDATIDNIYAVVDIVSGLLTSPKVRVTEGPPFVKDESTVATGLPPS